ncbi:MAG: glycoside hydrolase family 5 protein [Puniceicoccaceae bacterium]|nr:MAG: glycoside hydrolase family 5 protein [Puniceicoccaceae bacterium]
MQPAPFTLPVVLMGCAIVGAVLAMVVPRSFAAPAASRTDPEASHPPALQVKGNQILDAAGREVWLQGVNVASLEWSTEGEHVLRSIRVAVEDWGANVIRLPVTEDRWFGRAQGQEDGGRAYRDLVDAAIEAAAGRGAYLIIDLHRYRAPTPAHLEFWESAAVRYANHPAVLFSLLNEPHGIDWEVWKHGGPVGVVSDDSDGIENPEALEAFESVGMQRLLDAIRATGATNPVIAAGLDWGYDLSGILRGYALDDPAGNLIYDSHVYPWKQDWQRAFLEAAERFPVLIGEVGCEPEPMPWQNETEDPATWAPDMLGIIQERRLHWTAWCFHPSASPRLLADWDYTPTAFWGEPVRRALAGHLFPPGRLR